MDRLDHPLTWIIVIVLGLVLGSAVGAFQGAIVAYIGVPSFIVTLGGFLVWRGVAWCIASGQTIAPMDTLFRRLGGGSGRNDRRNLSWIVGVLACIAIVAVLAMRRRQRIRYGFGLRPMWAEIALGAVLCGAVLAAVWYLNRYFLPEGLVAQRGEPPGTNIPSASAYPGPDRDRHDDRDDVHRYPSPVRTLRLRHRRQPRGGRPRRHQDEANDRQDVRVDGFPGRARRRRAIARLNAAVSSLGTGMELNAIAAAVHRRHVVQRWGRHGRRCGPRCARDAVARLRHGPDGIEAPLQDIVVGIVLVVAVALDTHRSEEVCPVTERQGPPLAELRNIRVAFGGVHAVDDVTIDLYPGEVVGLVGGNGAGKTTLIRTLSGAHPADSGTILDRGQARDDHQPTRRQSPRCRDDLPDARARGQHRRARERVPRPGADDPLREPRRQRYGRRHAQADEPAEPEASRTSWSRWPPCRVGSASPWPSRERCISTRGSSSWTSRRQPSTRGDQHRFET